VACAPGAFCIGGSAQSMPCSPRSFSARPGSDACTSCPDGMTPNALSTSCEAHGATADGATRDNGTALTQPPSNGGQYGALSPGIVWAIAILAAALAVTITALVIARCNWLRKKQKLLGVERRAAAAAALQATPSNPLFGHRTRGPGGSSRAVDMTLSSCFTGNVARGGGQCAPAAIGQPPLPCVAPNDDDVDNATRCDIAVSMVTVGPGAPVMCSDRDDLARGSPYSSVTAKSGDVDSGIIARSRLWQMSIDQHTKPHAHCQIDQGSAIAEATVVSGPTTGWGVPESLHAAAFAMPAPDHDIAGASPEVDIDTLLPHGPRGQPRPALEGIAVLVVGDDSTSDMARYTALGVVDSESAGAGPEDDGLPVVISGPESLISMGAIFSGAGCAAAAAATDADAAASPTPKSGVALAAAHIESSKRAAAQTRKEESARQAAAVAKRPPMKSWPAWQDSPDSWLLRATRVGNRQPSVRAAAAAAARSKSGAPKIETKHRGPREASEDSAVVASPGVDSSSPDVGRTAVADATLPEPWIAILDSSSSTSRVYYHNTETSETTWKRPAATSSVHGKTHLI
jgi:hypothetical protein